MRSNIFTIILLMSTFLFIFQGQSQVYNMSTNNGQNISTCSGTFYDSGGPSANYLANESYTITFSPGTAGGFVQLDFTTWNIGPGDNLEIFDGPNTASPSFGVFNSQLSPVGMIIGASILNSSGSVTLQWSSVGSSGGWAANLSCGLPCQTFAATLQNSTPAFTVDSGIYYIDVCQHDTINLTASGSFLYNDSTYHQSDASSLYQWKFSNGLIDSNQTVTFIADTIAGYNVYLTMWDSNSCMSSMMPKIRIRVSTIPKFDGTLPFSPYLCQDDTTTLLGVVTPKHWQATSALNHAGVTYLPDGSGASYTSTLVFNQFATGQTVQATSNILGVCATMEHSYLGDLNITLTCPSGQSATLKSYPGGTSTFLGEPIDNNATAIPGVGYEYCWRPNGTTTMLNAVGSYSHSFVDALGNAYNNVNYLPPSTSYPANGTAVGPFPIVNYLPETNFSALIGCPLNGAWTITVTDNLAIDNGYIFNWGVEFAQNVLPVAWGYTPAYTTNSWNPNTYVVNNNGNSVLIQPADTGDYTYDYTVVDNLGCQYDTSVTVHVAPLPKVNLGSDTVICGTTILTLDAGADPQGSDYIWSTGNTSQTQLVNTSGSWTVTVTYSNPNISCSTTDSINIEQYPMAKVDLGPDTCLVNQDLVLDAENAGSTPPFLYKWNDGSTNQTLTASQSGIYSVEVAADFNSPCNVGDSILVIIMDDSYLGSDREFCYFEKELIELPPEASGATYSYQWYLDGQAVGIGENFFVLQEMKAGNYVLKLDVDGGCSESINVNVIDCKIEIPNIITPNGDGHNDNLVIDGLDNFENTQISIFNRWGKRVFESNNYHNGDWDGKNLADGVYFYTLQLNMGDVHKYEGTITIMR